MKHIFSILLILVLFTQCAIQYASQKQEPGDELSGALITVNDTMIAVNGNPVLVQERYSSTSLAAYSGNERGQRVLTGKLESLKIREEAERGDSSDQEYPVTLETGLYTNFLTVYNVLTACNTAEYTTARVGVRGYSDGVPLNIDRPESTQVCGNTMCIITEKSISVVSDKDTVLKTQYREEFVFKTKYSTQGISVPFDPKSETMPVHPKTGKTLYLDDVQDIMLYEAGDTVNTSIFEIISEELKTYRKRNRELFKIEPLCVVAKYNIPMIKVHKLLLTLREAGFSGIRVAMLGVDRRVK